MGHATIITSFTAITKFSLSYTDFHKTAFCAYIVGRIAPKPDNKWGNYGQNNNYVRKTKYGFH